MVAISIQGEIVMKLTTEIRKSIEKVLDSGDREKRFIIFPFGDVGIQVKNILNSVYGIQEAFILDNHVYKYNHNIKSLSFLGTINCRDYYIILASTNLEIHTTLREEVEKYFPKENIIELASMSILFPPAIRGDETDHMTQIGKYSYGPLCRDHNLIKSIGAFCSFATGVDVVENHEINYITTHPMIFRGANLTNYIEYAAFKKLDSYFPGVKPQREKLKKQRKITIGNDVWLGKNVIITNYANIGNGVIAGAGSIITKDVPDYAIVMGAPAKIIRYRYLPKEIESLNKIAWWNWTDEEIRERYNDFYLPADEFIRKYGVKQGKDV